MNIPGSFFRFSPPLALHGRQDRRQETAMFRLTLWRLLLDV